MQDGTAENLSQDDFLSSVESTVVSSVASSVESSKKESSLSKPDLKARSNKVEILPVRQARNKLCPEFSNETKRAILGQLEIVLLDFIKQEIPVFLERLGLVFQEQSTQLIKHPVPHNYHHLKPDEQRKYSLVRQD